MNDYIPNCKNCEFLNRCSVRKSLKEARETIYNIGRELSGRTDYIVDGKRNPEKQEC